MNNGRGFDTRGNNIDSLVIENTTFYNLTSRIVRDDGGGFIRYHKFDHNTVVNIGQFVSSPLEVQEMVWTNNLVINGGFLGQTDFSNADRQMIQIDSVGSGFTGQSDTRWGSSCAYQQQQFLHRSKHRRRVWRFSTYVANL